MIAFAKPDLIADAGRAVYAQWNPHADPPRWEFAGPCDCDCGCCDVLPSSIEVIIVHAPVD